MRITIRNRSQIKLGSWGCKLKSKGGNRLRDRMKVYMNIERLLGDGRLSNEPQQVVRLGQLCLKFQKLAPFLDNFIEFPNL